LSDANNPGEGEHKIMQFIRTQRSNHHYDPNTVHCLHGADADLIMLGLSTHEAHFYILREVVTDFNEKKCVLCGQVGHLMSECPGVKNEAEAVTVDGEASTVTGQSFKSSWKPLQFLQLPVLREYLANEFDFKDAPLSFPYDFERCVDDFVLMCFFVGNDFLPHLPSLSIHKGSIDQMLLLYVKILDFLGDYLTHEGSMNFGQVKKFVSYLASVEDEVFHGENRRKDAMKRRRAQEKAQTHFAADSVCSRKRHDNACGDASGDTNQSAASLLRETLTCERKKRRQDEGTGDANTGIDVQPSTLQQNVDDFKALMKEKQKAEREIEDPEDNVQLGIGNKHEWRFRYYQHKFHIASPDDMEVFSTCIASEYVLGLAWVLAYYYQGVPSWGWFFPFHYAPFASDLVQFGFERTHVEFSLGIPFLPFDQLMSVLPARSSHCLPKSFANLMKSPESTIIDFYPSKFKEDPDGKRYKWQWVILLPFVEEERLLSLTGRLAETLNEEEAARNSVGFERLFVSKHHPLAHLMLQLTDDQPLLIDEIASDKMFGRLRFEKDGAQPGTTIADPTLGDREAFVCTAVSSKFELLDKSPHICKLLAGVEAHSTELNDMDLSEKACLKMDERSYNAGRARRMILGSLGGMGVVTNNQQMGTQMQQSLHFNVGQHYMAAPRGRRPQQSSTIGGHYDNINGGMYGPGGMYTHDIPRGRGGRGGHGMHNNYNHNHNNHNHNSYVSRGVGRGDMHRQSPGVVHQSNSNFQPLRPLQPQHHQSNYQHNQSNYQHTQSNYQHHQSNYQHHQSNYQHHQSNYQHHQSYDRGTRGNYLGSRPLPPPQEGYWRPRRGG